MYKTNKKDKRGQKLVGVRGGGGGGGGVQPCKKFHFL